MLPFFRAWKCDNLVFTNYLKIKKNNFSDINNYEYEKGLLFYCLKIPWKLVKTKFGISFKIQWTAYFSQKNEMNITRIFGWIALPILKIIRSWGGGGKTSVATAQRCLLGIFYLVKVFQNINCLVQIKMLMLLNWFVFYLDW